MKKIVITLLTCIVSTSLISGDKPVVRTKEWQAQCDDLKKYNKWYIRDLYYAIKPNVKNVYTMLSSVPNAVLHSVIGHNSHDQQEAYVRFAPQDELGEAEKLFLAQRSRNTHAALESFLGESIDIDKQPRIAMCFSGGGFRSMILTLGFLVGAQDIGLLDSTTYISGLSGSTWLMAPWYATKKDLHTIRDDLDKKIGKGIHHLTHHKDRKEIIKQLLTKMWYRQCASAMDIYGPLLGNTLLSDLGNKKLTATLSDSHDHVIQGRYPMPIYASIATNYEPYEWFEFTPFEMGSPALGAYIPTWAYGRKFKNGKSVNSAPEQTLAYHMGIFGSAFEASIEDILRLGAEQIKKFKDDVPTIMQGALDTVIDKLVNSPLDDVRLAPSMLPNFMYQTGNHVFVDYKKLSLVDAGIDFNLPFAPLLRAARSVDIIIVFDSSAGAEIGFDLREAAKYAHRKGIKFPPIPENISTELCSVLRDPQDAECPIVIYMSRLKNDAYSTTFDPLTCIDDDYCGTFNFKYTKENIAELSGLAEFGCKQYMDTIRQVVADCVARKR